MPPNISYPDVNGNRTSYCSIELIFDGSIKLKGVKSINYRETHDIPKIRGTSAKPIGRPRGNVDFEGDIEFYQAEWNKILNQLTRGGAVGFAELGHTITITYAEPLSPADTVTDILHGARVHSPEQSSSESADVLVVKCSLSIMDITWANRFKGLRSLPR